MECEKLKRKNIWDLEREEGGGDLASYRGLQKLKWISLTWFIYIYIYIYYFLYLNYFYYFRINQNNSLIPWSQRTKSNLRHINVLSCGLN